jgi:hypothetical protein
MWNSGGIRARGPMRLRPARVVGLALMAAASMGWLGRQAGWSWTGGEGVTSGGTSRISGGAQLLDVQPRQAADLERLRAEIEAWSQKNR